MNKREGTHDKPRKCQIPTPELRPRDAEKGALGYGQCRPTVKTASITVNWGSPKDTVVTMNSLASMTVKPDFLICVDNGSSAEHVSELRMGAPKAIIIEPADNTGVASANNIGMEYALSHGVDWTLLLNNDAIPDRKCLERCIAEAAAGDRIAILGPAVTFADQPDQLWFAGGEVSLWFAFPHHTALRKSAANLPPTSRNFYRLRLYLLCPCLIGCMARSSAHFERTTSCTTTKRNGVNGPEPSAGDAAISARFSVYTLLVPVAAVAEAWGSQRTWPTISLVIHCDLPLRQRGSCADAPVSSVSSRSMRHSMPGESCSREKPTIGRAYVQGLADAVRGRMGTRPTG